MMLIWIPEYSILMHQFGFQANELQELWFIYFYNNLKLFVHKKYTVQTMLSFTDVIAKYMASRYSK